VALAWPALGAARSAAASGASPVTVSVKAIDREGNAVSATAQLTSASSLAVQDVVTTGRASTVPPGTYNVAALVQEPGGNGVTLVERAVTITSATTIVLDARHGHQLTFAVNDHTVHLLAVAAAPFSPSISAIGTPYGFTPVWGEPEYIAPGTLPKGWELVLQGDLARGNGTTLSPVEYDLVHVVTGTIPASFTFSAVASSLARDNATVRAVDHGRTAGLQVAPLVTDPPLFPSTTSYPFALGTFGQSAVVTPYTIDLYLTPGYQWELKAQSGADTDLVTTGTLPAKHVGTSTLNSAVFGPSPLLDIGVTGNELSTGAGVDPGEYPSSILVGPADPTKGIFDSPSGLDTYDPQAWIYRGGTLLAHASGSGHPWIPVTAPVSSTPQSYTFRVQADRLSAKGTGAATGLAASVTASLTFQAWQGEGGLLASEVFWPQMSPQGLSAANAAGAGTKTVVPITFAAQAGAIAVHGVDAWASDNGGKTWTVVKATGSGGKWTVTVSNPAKAGYVSLKVQGTSAAGFTSTVTAINAYDVS
jgi:hypothetical protein